MTESILQDRDYIVIIAETMGSQAVNPPRFAQRWSKVRVAIETLIQTCQQLDPDGITLYVSEQSSEIAAFKKYEQVKADQLNDILKAEKPPETLELGTVLKTALEDYFERRTAGQLKPQGEVILLLLDGEPRDRMAVAKLIKQATQKLESDRDLRIGLVQIGEDPIAQGYMQALDENLQAAGAKFDIVSTHLIDEIQPESFTQFLMQILADSA
jgi:hypothetical protein